MNRKTIAIIATVLVLGGCLAGGLYYLECLENYDELFYSQVNDNRLRELSSSDTMKYEYTLDCYNKNGKKRELVFKTSRILKNGAYIALEVRSLGVHKWEKVQYSDLPPKAQEEIK